MKKYIKENGIYILINPIAYLTGSKFYSNFKSEILYFYICLMTVFALSTSCSAEKECKTCHAEFINVNTGQKINVESDCERVPPAEGYVFVKCVDKPSY